MRARARARTRARARATRTRTHAHAHARACARTRTRTRTHTQPKPKPTAGRAQVNVLRSLLPVLGQLENLVVETSVGWWLRRYNVSRHEGAELYASLLEQVVVW